MNPLQILPEMKIPELLTPYLPLLYIILIPIIFGVLFFKFGHTISIIVGVALSIFGPSFFPEFFNQVLVSIPFFSMTVTVTVFTLVFWATFFIIVHRFTEFFNSLTGTLGPFWGTLVLVAIGFILGILVTKWYPEFIEKGLELLHLSKFS